MNPAKLIEEARRHCSPMYIKLLKPVLRGSVAFLAGEVHPTKHYNGAGAFVMMDTTAGPVRLLPEDFAVLCWRWHPPLPTDKKVKA